MTWSNQLCLWVAIMLCLSGKICLAANAPEGGTNLLEIQSLTINDRSIPIAGKNRVRLGSYPQNIIITFGFITNAPRSPIRVERKLEGYDNSWNIGGGVMFMVVRFYDSSGNVVAKTDFEVHGNSAGWRNNLKDSALTHRREAIMVPPKASRVMVVMTSAGPQSTEGVYVVSDLSLSTQPPGREPKTLLQFPGDQFITNATPNVSPNPWVQDGLSPGMAQIIDLGDTPSTKALEILDNDPFGHAEWHNGLPAAVRAGDSLVLEWNEMYSIGESGSRLSTYPSLLPGNYLFRVREMNLFGVPTGIETALALNVPPPFWQTFWFRSCIAVIFTASLIMVVRYIVWVRTRRKMMLLEKQRLLELERLRIARDIHDDLGARVTQISLVSAMAHDNSADVNTMRGELLKISRMSRDLVTALYETVWTVNPENDNLKELGNYLFQMINDLCEQSQLRCRFHIEDLPSEVTVPSNIRHNLCMVVKEAINNTIKHAGASEVKFNISYANLLLTVAIHDDGRGFSIDKEPDGYGLGNMKSRLEEIGGSCQIDSRPGEGTTITIFLKI